MKPSNALMALEMREAFEEAWLAPAAEAWLDDARFPGRTAWGGVDLFCGISHPESELAREPKARPSSTVPTRRSTTASEEPCESTCGGVMCQSLAISES